MKNLTPSATESAELGEFSSYIPQQDQFLRRTALLMVCREQGQLFTAGQIADFVGCTRQHVDLIEKSAFKKLRAALAAAEPDLVTEVFPKHRNT